MSGVEWVGPPLDNLHPADVLEGWPCDLGEVMNVFIVLAEYRTVFGAWPSRLWIPKAKADLLQSELTWSGWSAVTTKLKVKVSSSFNTLSCSGDEGVAFYGCVEDGASDYGCGEAAEWLYGLQAWLLWEEP